MHKIYQIELALASQSHLIRRSNYHCKIFDDMYLATSKCLSIEREHSRRNKTPMNHWNELVKGRILIIQINESALWMEIGFFGSGP